MSEGENVEGVAFVDDNWVVVYNAKEFRYHDDVSKWRK